MAQSWASFLLLALFSSSLLVCGSNGERVFLYPQSQKVSSIVSQRYRTAYHFQPPKNWINGMFFICLSSSSSACLLPGPSVDFLAVANQRVWSVIWFAFLVLGCCWKSK
uniref:Uncharacterized protein n=1 Tax=Aegilops tauschii subsp. strangulata TaxID=200361 RepID=A0A453GUR1_AEGTS